MKANERTAIRLGVQRRLRSSWALLARTGVEAEVGRDPSYLSWFLGFPLVSWLATSLLVIGIVWDGSGTAVPVIVLGAALLNICATARVLHIQGAELRRLQAALANPSDRSPPIEQTHEAWRSRSATWGYLASLVALSFLTAVRFLPSWALSDLFPPNLLPLYDLVILALTVAMIAVLSQYTSRTAAADARSTSLELRRMSSAIASQAERTSAQLSADLSGLTSRLTQSLSDTAQEANTVLVRLTDAVGELAVAATAQSEAIARALSSTEAALSQSAEAAVDNANAVRDLASSREEQLRAEVERLKPRIALKPRVAGTFFHHVWLDLYNEGSQAVGLVLEIRSGRGSQVIPIGNLPSRIPKPVDLGDVGGYPDDGKIAMALDFSDLSGRRYWARHSFHFMRSKSLLGTTTGWGAEPSGWVRIDSHLDIPSIPEVPVLD